MYQVSTVKLTHHKRTINLIIENCLIMFKIINNSENQSIDNVCTVQFKSNLSHL